MADVIAWSNTADQAKAIDMAVQALGEGRLVAFPTETVYGVAASALAPEAMERLGRSKGRSSDKPLALVVGSSEEALDWVPGLSLLGRRLLRRCWPGPLTLVCGDGVEDGLATRLPGAVRERVCPQGTLGLRSPAHRAIHKVIRRLPGPLALTSANQSGQPEATTAAGVLEALGDHLALVVDDGPSRYGQASTVVRLERDTWSVLREGVVPAAQVEELTRCLIVFVCTGNTCRSPLAESLCKKVLAERLACAPDDLPRRGFVVMSAGLAAMAGAPAAAEAIESARELGADLNGHTSQPLTPDLVDQADFLVAMTRGHLLALARQGYQLGSRARLLCPEGHDVNDPIGGDQAIYRECSRQILGHVQRWVAELVP